MIIAARPNLNIKGVLTLHEVNPGGVPQYGRALRHVEGRLCLGGAIPHVGAAAKRIFEGASKFPVASLVGVEIPEIFALWEPLSYDPRVDPDFFWCRGRIWEGPDIVLLEGTRAWVAK